MVNRVPYLEQKPIKLLDENRVCRAQRCLRIFLNSTKYIHTTSF